VGAGDVDVVDVGGEKAKGAERKDERECPE